MATEVPAAGTSAAVPANGKPPKLTKEQLADRTRFRFREEDIELPELGGTVTLKSLTVGEREDLPDMVDEEGKPDGSVAKIAQLVAAAVSEPKMTAEEVAAYIPFWPAEALDKLLIAYGKMNGNEEELAAAAKEFRDQQ